MRIAMLSWETLHSIALGGVAVHVTEISAALQRLGHEIHVFTRMAWNGHAQYELIHGVHYHRVPYAGCADIVDDVNSMCRSFVTSVYQTEDFMGAHFDIVHAHDWLASNAMVWIKQGRGRKGIFTLHSTEYGRSGNNFFGGRSKRIMDHERHGSFCADRVIGVSWTLLDEAKWIYNIPDWKACMVYNGISYQNFNGGIDQAQVKASCGIGPMDPTVLYVGRMTQQKGPDLLVEAIPFILRYHPNAKFILSGEGDMRGLVETRARQLGVSHACRFYGMLERGRVIDIYKACDCVCIPSRNEPFGIVVLEAWAASKPVVATNNGGPSEFVWHDVNGYKINPQPQSIAWGIGTLFSNFEHARWMGKNGRVAAETTFSWDTIAGHTYGVYIS